MSAFDLPDNGFRYVPRSYYSATVDRFGMVHSVFEDETGEREESTVPLCESPIVDALPEWIWDLTLDPRDQP